MKILTVTATALGILASTSLGYALDQKSLITELRNRSSKVISYKGRLDILKNSIHETAELEYTTGKTVLHYTSGPHRGKDLVVKNGVCYKEVLGIKVPIPVPSKVFRAANGDMGPGYVIARMNEERERIASGTPITTEIKDAGKRIVIDSRYTGKGTYRYRRAEVMVDKDILLPVYAAYDTDGDGRYDEVYKFSFADIRFAK